MTAEPEPDPEALRTLRIRAAQDAIDAGIDDITDAWHDLIITAAPPTLALVARILRAITTALRPS